MARLAFEMSELRVLLVEDDTFARELEGTALQKLGVGEMTVVSSGEEALLAVESGIEVDVIIADWNMPRFDGLQLLRVLRKKSPEIAFLMATNNELLDQIHIAMEAGVDAYVSKPVSLDKLREMIQLALVTRMLRTKSPTAAPNGGNKTRANPKLQEICATIENAISQPMAEDAKVDGERTAESLDGASKLAETLSSQLTGFMGPLEDTSEEELKVIQLHIDCMRAVLSGREDLLEHETRNMIVDGLSLAIDMVSP